MENYSHKAEQSCDETKMRVRTWQEEGEKYVRENPMKTALSSPETPNDSQTNNQRVIWATRPLDATPSAFMQEERI